MIACQLAFTYAPPLQAMFHTRPLAPLDWLGPLGAGLWVWATVEASRRWRLVSR